MAGYSTTMEGSVGEMYKTLQTRRALNASRVLQAKPRALHATRSCFSCAQSSVLRRTVPRHKRVLRSVWRDQTNTRTHTTRHAKQKNTVATRARRARTPQRVETSDARHTQLYKQCTNSVSIDGTHHYRKTEQRKKNR